MTCLSTVYSIVMYLISDSNQIILFFVIFFLLRKPQKLSKVFKPHSCIYIPYCTELYLWSGSVLVYTKNYSTVLLIRDGIGTIAYRNVANRDCSVVFYLIIFCPLTAMPDELSSLLKTWSFWCVVTHSWCVSLVFSVCLSVCMSNSRCIQDI